MKKPNKFFKKLKDSVRDFRWGFKHFQVPDFVGWDLLRLLTLVAAVWLWFIPGLWFPALVLSVFSAYDVYILISRRMRDDVV